MVSNVDLHPYTAVGDYGGVGSAAGFAELVARVCDGECHVAAALWSPVARALGPRSLGSDSECAAICAAEATCDVYTWWYATEECELKRALPR